MKNLKSKMFQPLNPNELSEIKGGIVGGDSTYCPQNYKERTQTSEGLPCGWVQPDWKTFEYQISWGTTGENLGGKYYQIAYTIDRGADPKYIGC